jgi:stalled ribosome rescue protein Dom34
MTSQHVIVWIDQQEARVLGVDGSELEASLARPPRHHIRHPKGPTAEHHHPDDARQFFQAVAHELESAAQILVVGPSTTKLHFIRYLKEHNPKLEARVVGIESADHPTDRQLAAHAKRYFDIVERR